MLRLDKQHRRRKRLPKAGKEIRDTLPTSTVSSSSGTPKTQRYNIYA